jgi:hypothetical protein
VLCDPEPPVAFGAPVGGRNRTAFAPPELARALAVAAAGADNSGGNSASDNKRSGASGGECGDYATVVVMEGGVGTTSAAEGFGVRGLGAMAFGLCAGRSLPRDTGGDFPMSAGSRLGGRGARPLRDLAAAIERASSICKIKTRYAEP